ncbi:MAG: D-alanyl-D-alanine carboxypeptidase [Actinobacteria bacterium]|nr:D-alanyl-D-alanine carboxypeptidase [Actinomycetota bacterium]
MSVFSVLAGRRALCGFFAARTSPVVASASSQVRALTCGSLAAPALRSATAPRLPSWLPPNTSEAGDSVELDSVGFSDGDDGSDDVGEAEGDADGLAVSSSRSTRGAGTSTLKTLTALTLLPQLEPDATWIGTARAQNTYGSKAGIRKGREYTIDELFAGLLLPSGNDAAIALAQAHSTVSATVAEMNQVARDLQAYNTTAKNPSGLDAKGQFSTAYDLALIGRAAIAREDFLTYAGSKSAEFPNPRKPKKNGKERKPITIYNQNDLVMENYRGAIGVKTGYTSQAGRTFIGAAQRGNTTLIVSLMGIREPSDEAARKLLNWGFQNRGQIVPIGELVPPLSAMAPTVAEETVVPTAPTPVAATVRGSAPQQIVAEPELSSLSPTSWGWLTVFTIALVLALVSLIRRIVTRKQRRALT